MPPIPPEPADLLAVCPSWSHRHATRLRDVYRSAGWPYQDVVEVELLAAGLLERVDAPDAAPRVRVTDHGLQAITASRQRNKAACTPHQVLVDTVTDWLHRTQGRLAWQGPQIFSPLASDPPMASPAADEPLPEPALLPPEAGALPEPPRKAARWRTCIPDVYSLRNSSVQAYLEPAVYEIKVSRADLLGDLRNPDKRGAYLAIASQCWYVLGLDRLGRPIAAANEIPLDCGVLLSGPDGLAVARPAPCRALPALPFPVWMALARCSPARPSDGEPWQAPLSAAPSGLQP